MAQRGRPKSNETLAAEQAERPTKFERVYTDADGGKQVWKYDLNKNPHGPIEVDIVYPKGTKVAEELEASLPKTKRRYLNPKNGKFVSYQRAKSLGLVD